MSTTGSDTAPGWPALIVAKVLVWLRWRLLDLADRSMRRPRLRVGRDLAQRSVRPRRASGF
jgi:hypothetical protein